MNPPGTSSTTNNQDPEAVHHQDADADLDDDSLDENDGHATTIRRSLSIHGDSTVCRRSSSIHGDSPARDADVDDDLLDDDNFIEPHGQRQANQDTEVSLNQDPEAVVDCDSVLR